MIGGIEAKFCAAWKAIENPAKDETNPHFKNRYASLSATLEAVRKACDGAGIVYVQSLRRCGEELLLESAVMDSDGSRMELSQFPVTPLTNPQQFGSCVTYMKRYQAQADWGMAAEDDDGNAASGPVTAACTACGAQYKFDSQLQMDNSACVCGNRTFRAV